MSGEAAAVVGWAGPASPREVMLPNAGFSKEQMLRPADHSTGVDNLGCEHGSVKGALCRAQTPSPPRAPATAGTHVLLCLRSQLYAKALLEPSRIHSGTHNAELRESFS